MKAQGVIAVNAPIAYVPKNEVPCVRFSEKGNKVGLFIQNFRDFSDEEQVLALKVAFDMVATFASAIKNRGKSLPKPNAKSCKTNDRMEILMKKRNEFIATQSRNLHQQSLKLKDESKKCSLEFARLGTLLDLDKTQNIEELEKLSIEKEKV